MIDWNIQSRAHSCQRCSNPFEDKQPYHTLLFSTKAGHERRDVCRACWPEEKNQAASEKNQVISQWQGVYEAPPPPTAVIRKDTAEGILFKLAELNDPQYLAPMFILAVMLERKRLLKVKDQVKQDGKRLLIYEKPKSGEVLAITDPELSMDQLEAVQREVSRLLEEGIPNQESTSAPPATEEENDAAKAEHTDQPEASPEEPATEDKQGA
jgi:post-segregation antitoxin (ccd killing protein)